MKYNLWVGEEIVMVSDSIESLKIEIDHNYESYDEVVITDNDENIIYINKVV